MWYDHSMMKNISRDKQSIKWLKTLLYSFYKFNYIKFVDNDIEWARKRDKRFTYMFNLRNIESIYDGLDK